MKNLVFEMDKTVLITPEQHWIPHTSNIFKITYSWQQGEATSISYGLGSYGWGPYGLAGSSEITRSERERTLKIGSVIVDEFSYTSVDDLDDLSTIDRSFYFDNIRQVLYVRFDLDKSPWQFGYIVVGVTLGFSQIMTYYNDIFYDSRIISGPDLTYESDPLIFGKLSIDTFSIQLNNNDRFFDALDQIFPYGNSVRIYYGELEDTFDDLQQVFSGFFEEFSINENLCTIIGSDDRKRLSIDVAGSMIDSSLYDNMKEGEYYKPLVYGQVSKLPCIPLDNEDRDLTHYRFYFYDRNFFDNNATITTVYVENIVIVPTEYSVSSTGILTINNTSYQSGQKVTADVIGSNIVNPLEIIEHLLLKFPGYQYNSFYFNTIDWEDAKAKVLSPISLSIIKPESLFSVIEQICNTVFGSFIAWPDGRFSFKVRDTTETPVKIIQPIDFIEKPEIVFKQDEYLSSLRILYDKQVGLDEYREYTFDKDKLKLAALFNRQRTIELQTLLVNRDEAIQAAELIYDEFAGIFPTITMILKLETIDVYVGDNIDAYIAVLKNGQYGAIRLEVVAVNYDFNQHSYSITGRYIDWLFDYTNDFLRFVSNEEVKELAPYE